jgi:hypothetical protein
MRAVVGQLSNAKRFLILLAMIVVLGAAVLTVLMRPADCQFTAIFRDAVLYSGSTHFVFELDGGVEMVLVEYNDPGAAEVDGSDLLLFQPGDGPAEANRKVIGKPIEICILKNSGGVRLEL